MYFLVGLTYKYMKLLQGLSAPGMRKYSVSVHSIGTKNEKKRRLGGKLHRRWGRGGQGLEFPSYQFPESIHAQGKISRCSRSCELVILFVVMV